MKEASATFFEIASEYEIDIFKHLLSAYGLHGGTRLAILNWHYRNTYYDNSADSFSKLMLATVHRMESLEAFHQGAVAFLSEKPYRIRMFCRYSAEYLAELYELRNEDVPYILCISAVADSNHSMNEVEAWDVFEKTRTKLRKLGFRIRAIEVSQKLPAAYAVLRLDAQIGGTYKNSGVWLRTHSHRHVVDLEGLGKERGHITSSDFDSQKELVQALRGTLAPHAQLIIDGCMTGKEGGIAHSFTNVFDEVIGFGTSTTVTSITPRKRPDGSLRFDVQYAKDVDDENWINEPGKVIKRK